MGRHAAPPAARRTASAVNTRFALAPLLLVAAVIAALTIISQGMRTETLTSPARNAPSGSAPAVIAPQVAPLGSASPGIVPLESMSPSARAASPRNGSGSSGTSAQRSTAGTVRLALLGKPDFDGYCQVTGQGHARLVADNAYGWRCAADNGTGDAIQAVCAWTYHTSTITNRVGDFNNPDTWQCWRANRRLGSLNFNTYCLDTGHSGTFFVDGANAYGWYCANDGNTIDTQAACRRLYGGGPAISRFANFYDKNSWECWG
jgi:hypothetical protein